MPNQQEQGEGNEQVHLSVGTNWKGQYEKSGGSPVSRERALTITTIEKSRATGK